MTRTATDIPADTAGDLRSRPRIEHFDGAAIAADPKRFAKAYEDVYSHAIELSDHCDPPISDRLIRHSERPGFGLIAALDGDEVAGFVYGYTLPVDTLWWDGLTPTPDPEFVREYPGRTVGVCELLVGRPWRRFHLGLTLYAEFLASRTEERAAALVAEGNDVILDRHEEYGFTHVGQMEPYPGWRPHHMVVRSLHDL